MALLLSVDGQKLSVSTTQDPGTRLIDVLRANGFTVRAE